MTQQQQPLEPHQAQLREWTNNPKVLALLDPEPEMVGDLAIARRKAPLPPGYTPTEIIILFDDVPYLVWLRGEIKYARECPENYEPRFMEWRFDNDIAWFQVGAEVMVNRLEAIAQLDAQRGILGSLPLPVDV